MFLLGEGRVAIAGFLSTLLNGGDAAKALHLAATAASLCIQSTDTISLLTDMLGLEAIAQNAERLENEVLPEKEWRYCAEEQLYLGSRDHCFGK